MRLLTIYILLAMATFAAGCDDDPDPEPDTSSNTPTKPKPKPKPSADDDATEPCGYFGQRCCDTDPECEGLFVCRPGGGENPGEVGEWVCAHRSP